MQTAGPGHSLFPNDQAKNPNLLPKTLTSPYACDPNTGCLRTLTALPTRTHPKPPLPTLTLPPLPTPTHPKPPTFPPTRSLSDETLRDEQDRSDGSEAGYGHVGVETCKLTSRVSHWPAMAVDLAGRDRRAAGAESTVPARQPAMSR
jgi:hypothetical protein